MTQKEWQRDNEQWEAQVEKERTMADAILSPFYAPRRRLRLSVE